jgi:hypothetical protein
MPIRWGVNHAARLVSATGTGVLVKTDFDAYLDDLASAATLTYGKIFRMDNCRLALSKDCLDWSAHPKPRSGPIDGQGRSSRDV